MMRGSRFGLLACGLAAWCVVAVSSCGSGPGVHHDQQPKVYDLEAPDVGPGVVPVEVGCWIDSGLCPSECWYDCWYDVWDAWDAWDAGPEEVSDAPYVPQPGEFMWPCAGDSECLSGLCVGTRTGFVCTRACVEDCPGGWVCRQMLERLPEYLYACLPPDAVLCMPCSESQQCMDMGAGGGEACVDFVGMQGTFCGTACYSPEECPPGFVCKYVEVIGGDVPAAFQCVPEDGSCECTQFAADKAAVGTCWTANEFGSCEGKHHCNEALELICEGPMAEAEACDGQDNDCDGVTDEELPDTDQDGKSDCIDDDDDGDLDKDVTDCAPLDPKVSHFADEECNGEDDDCDGETDEKGADGCTAWYLDVDQDGYGVETLTACLCEAEDLYTTTQAGDCAPLAPAVNPGAKEVLGNGLDDDCDGKVE